MIGRALLAAAVLLCACGDDDEGPSRELEADARLLSEAMVEDPAAGALEEVDEAMLDDLPARAAELLESGAIPASRQQAERVEALEMSTAEGRRLRRRLLDAYRARTAALEQYREALARGHVEDLRLTDSMRAQREAHERLLDIDEALAGILGREEPERERRDEREPSEPAPR